MSTPDQGFPAVWDRALEALDVAGVTPQQRAFVRLARPVGLLDGTALIAAPNDLTKEVLEQRMRETITGLLSEQLGHPVRLAVTVDPSLADDPPEVSPPSGTPRVGPQGTDGPSEALPPHVGRPVGSSAAGPSTGSFTTPATWPPMEHTPSTGHSGTLPAAATPVVDEVIDIRTFERPGVGLAGAGPVGQPGPGQLA